MDLDTASVCSPVSGSTPPAVETPSPPADPASMQPDTGAQSMAPSQAVQCLSNQQQQQQQQRGHAPLSSHAAMQPLHELHHATHGSTAERLTSQQSPSTSQGHSQGHGATHSLTQTSSSFQGLRQSHAGQSPGYGEGEEHGAPVATLQHASSTSAMMSLAQQASQSSWNAHQQPVKRHSRHTGQLEAVAPKPSSTDLCLLLTTGPDTLICHQLTTP